MARLFKKKQPQEESEIDLTPMLDVVFIMLIFFIVTASFVSEDGFRTNRPPEAPPTEDIPTEKNATFIVTETDEIWLDGRRIDVRSVRANVERILAENPQATVTVRAHELATAGIYIGITDQSIEALGVTNASDERAVSLVTYRD